MFKEEQLLADDRALPEWTSTSISVIWEPGQLYIAWLTFLDNLWKGVEYL